MSHSRQEQVVKQDALFLDQAGLFEYQRNRPPYLLIDEAHEVIPGVSAKGHKLLKPDLWFFECHFPGDPNMPGMLQIEALVQLTALTILTLPGHKGKVAYVISASHLKFIRKIVPGDRLDLEGRLLSWKRGIGQCTGKGLVNGQLAFQADFQLALPDVLSEFTPAKK